MSQFDEEYFAPGDAAFAGPNLTEEMRLGQACAGLLNSEAYRLVQAAIQERIITAFKNTPVRDVEGLTYLRVFQQVLDDHERLLVEAAETGKMAAIQLTEQEKRDTQEDAPQP